jgi:oligosaccharide repeat unit polymerase
MAPFSPTQEDRTSFGSLYRAAPRVASNASTTIRLSFYIVYYLLNVLFSAELFSFALTLPVFVVCCFNISRIKGNYATAQDMIWLVIYLFFVIAPCQALRLGYFDNNGPVGGLYFDDVEIITAELIVFVFLLVASITTVVASKFYPAGTIETNYQINDRRLTMLLLLNVLAFFLFVLFTGGLGNVLSSREARADGADTPPITTAFLALQAITCFFTCIYVKTRPQGSIILSILSFLSCAFVMALLMVSQNPYNAARFFLLMAYLPVLLIFLSGRIPISLFYVGAMVGLMVLMPILNFTGRYGMSLSEASEQINISQYVFKAPFIDVFDMLVYEVRYLHDGTLFWGRKSLGILLFFVPRSIWTAKETLIAQDMGAELVEMGTAGTDNLSLFFAGEFYADLGFIGVAIGAFFVSLLLTIFGLRQSTRINGLDLHSYIFIAAAPIIVRGPIGGVIPPLFMQMIFLTILTRLLCHRTVPEIT